MVYKSSITENDLRSRRICENITEFTVEPDVYVSPGARAYLNERKIKLIIKDKSIEVKDTKDTDDNTTCEENSKKSENMTQLRANILVSKNYPRISFRGKLDTLEAKILEIQVIANEEGYLLATADLQEALNYVRQILGSEVKEIPFEINTLIGYNNDELMEIDQNIKEYIGISPPVPDFRMGKFAIGLNSLRALVKETELLAMYVFSISGVQERTDLIEALNRLASCIYIIFCRVVAGKYYEKR